jgi:hypothetical protein
VALLAAPLVNRTPPAMGAGLTDRLGEIDDREAAGQRRRYNQPPMLTPILLVASAPFYVALALAALNAFEISRAINVLPVKAQMARLPERATRDEVRASSLA